MEKEHWGRFLENDSNFTSPYLLSFDEIEKISKDVNFDSLNRNAKSENAMTTQMMPISYFEFDPITQHTIKLLQYVKQMYDLHQQLQQAQHSFKNYSIENIPHVPVKPTKNQVHEHPSINLTKKGVQQVLHRSIYLICAHEGFESTTESVISLLTGVVEEMLQKFCNLLKVNTEREVLGMSTGYIDAVERTLHDVGINGIKDLHSFHTNRVIRYNERLLQRSQNLRRACVKAFSQIDSSKSNNFTAAWEDLEWTEWSGNDTTDVTDNPFTSNSLAEKSKADQSLNDESINQLHLDDNTTISAPGLESGLRMLDTLEQQESIGTPGSEHNQSMTPTHILKSESVHVPSKRNEIKKQRKILRTALSSCKQSQDDAHEYNYC